MPDADLETHEPLQSPGASLADEMYGKPDPVVEPEPQQEPVAEEIEPEEPEHQKPEAEAEAEAGHAGDPEEIEVTTLEGLADHLETDPDWLRGLKVTEKVNGHDIEVSISDALRTHRQVSAGDEYLADAKAKAKQIMGTSTQEKELVAGSAAVLAGLIKEAETAVNGSMSEEDWAKLRRDDPAEYSAKKQDVQDRVEKIGAMKARAMAAFAQTGAQMNEQQQAFRDQNLPREREIFLNLVPEWADEEVAAKESSEISEYLSAQGHTPEEIQIAAYNGKLLAYVRNSMLYEKSKGKVNAAKKKVVKIPKVMKPGKAKEDKKPNSSGNDRVNILYG